MRDRHILRPWKGDTYMNKLKTRRIAINIDEKLLARIDEYAEFMGVTRTAAISFLCGNQLFQNDTVNAISGAVDVINKQDKKSKPKSKS